MAKRNNRLNRMAKKASTPNQMATPLQRMRREYKQLAPEQSVAAPNRRTLGNKQKQANRMLNKAAKAQRENVRRGYVSPEVRQQRYSQAFFKQAKAESLRRQKQSRLKKSILASNDAVNKIDYGSYTDGPGKRGSFSKYEKANQNIQAQTIFEERRSNVMSKYYENERPKSILRERPKNTSQLKQSYSAFEDLGSKLGKVDWKGIGKSALKWGGAGVGVAATAGLAYAWHNLKTSK